MTERAVDKCSFCGEQASPTRIVISGPLVFICAPCVILCVQIVDEKREIAMRTLGAEVAALRDAVSKLTPPTKATRKKAKP